MKKTLLILAFGLGLAATSGARAAQDALANPGTVDPALVPTYHAQSADLYIPLVYVPALNQCFSASLGFVPLMNSPFFLLNDLQPASCEAIGSR